MALKDLITVELQVALDSDPREAPQWSTIASNALGRLRSWEINRGRNSTLDAFQAGTASFVLDNRDRAFDPLHATGPHFGKLKPNKRIRLLVTYEADFYARMTAARSYVLNPSEVRFDGYVDGWPQTYPSPSAKDALVELKATDGFKGMARKTVPSVHRQVVEADDPAGWYRHGESSGTMGVDSSGHGGTGTYEGGATFNARAGLAVNDSDGAIEYTGSESLVIANAGVRSTEYTIEALVNLYPVDGDSHTDDASDPVYDQQFPTGGVGISVDVAHRSMPAPGVVLFTDGGVSVRSSVRVDDNRAHHIAVRRDAGNNLTVWVDGVDRTVSPAAATSTPAAGVVTIGRHSWSPIGWHAVIGVIDEVAWYDSALGDARIAAHHAAALEPWEGHTPAQRITAVLDYIGWPAADRDLDTGSATLGPARLEDDALSHLQLVGETEGGRFFVSRDGKVTLVGRANGWTEGAYTTSQGVFSDDGAGLPYGGFGWDYSDAKVRNDIRISAATSSEVVAGDAVSQGEYGAITYSQSSLEADIAKVQSQAEWILAKHKDAAFEVESLKINPLRAPASLFPAVLGAELGYRYTIEHTPQGVGSQISEEVHLEGTSEAGDSDSYTFSWLLSRAEPAVWVLGASSLGADTRLGF